MDSATPNNTHALPSEHTQENSASEYQDGGYELLIDGLSYLSIEDLAVVEKAFLFAEKAHATQRRESGEFYICHPLAVATMLADWKMDAPGIIAALLHDVIEDSGVPKEELTRLFGAEVAELVDGLSKLEKMETQTRDIAQAENFRKMIISTTRDLRVIMIKFADRLHNLQTLKPFRAEKRWRIARETLEVYAPIASRLGVRRIAQQLQDMSFEELHPMRFKVVAKAMKTARKMQRELFSNILEGLRAALAENKVNASVTGREKSVHSTYLKMRERHLSFSQVSDIYGFRIVVHDVLSCYLALGVLHTNFKIVPGKIKDYIAQPKPNGYQSLHTTLLHVNGTPMEIQIRTEAMDHWADNGFASHWLYKDEDDWGLQEKTHEWLKGLVDMQGKVDSAEFFTGFKDDITHGDVFVFTSAGDMYTLPRGATIIDFAYALHSDVGTHCVAARVNHEIFPLTTELITGSQVEIITANDTFPSPEWLNHAKTGRARSLIRQYLRKTHQDGSNILGKNIFHHALKSFGVDAETIPPHIWQRFVHETGKDSAEAIFSEIGLGLLFARPLAQQMIAFEDVHISTQSAVNTPFMVGGIDNISTYTATCCQPIPRKPIMGYMAKNKGLVIHELHCASVHKLQENEPLACLPAKWADELEQYFSVHLQITVKDILGMLGRVASAISEAEASILQCSVDRNQSRFVNLHFLVKIANRAHLATLMKNVRRIANVEHIERKQEGSGFSF